MEFTKTKAKIIAAWKQKKSGFVMYTWKRKPKLENKDNWLWAVKFKEY